MKISKVSLRFLLLSLSVFSVMYIAGCDSGKKGSGTVGDSTRTGRTPAQMVAPDSAKQAADTVKHK